MPALLLQRCKECSQAYFPPQPFCPHCVSRDVEAFEASGKATLYSYVITHRTRPDFGAEPYAIASVMLSFLRLRPHSDVAVHRIDARTTPEVPPPSRLK